MLAAAAAACALAAVSMQAVVGAIADAKLPLSRASAAMVLLLLLALPVDEADESLVRSLPLTSGAGGGLGRRGMGRVAASHRGPRD